MTFTDRLLQRWRIAKVRPFIRPGARVLDIGSADGALFQRLPGLDRASLGIDPTLETNISVNGVDLIAGFFPDDLPPVAPFDVITLLAVLEHFPAASYTALNHGCARFLKPGGRLLITVPSARVDSILAVLKCLRLIDGMSLEEHHGYDVDRTPEIFSGEAFRLLQRRTFQLGLNHLFVFERVGH